MYMCRVLIFEIRGFGTTPMILCSSPTFQHFLMWMGFDFGQRDKEIGSTLGWIACESLCPKFDKRVFLFPLCVHQKVPPVQSMSQIYALAFIFQHSIILYTSIISHQIIQNNTEENEELICDGYTSNNNWTKVFQAGGSDITELLVLVDWVVITRVVLN